MQDKIEGNIVKKRNEENGRIKATEEEVKETGERKGTEVWEDMVENSEKVVGPEEFIEVEIEAGKEDIGEREPVEDVNEENKGAVEIGSEEMRREDVEDDQEVLGSFKTLHDKTGLALRKDEESERKEKFNLMDIMVGQKEKVSECYEIEEDVENMIKCSRSTKGNCSHNTGNTEWISQKEKWKDKED